VDGKEGLAELWGERFSNSFTFTATAVHDILPEDDDDSLC